MKALSNGGQAFPNPHYEDDNLQGMTLRDYFAAKAMQSFLTAAGINKAGVPGTNNFEFFIAEMAYKLADAMIREREKP